MIRVKLYQNKNEKNETAFKKWYPRVVNEETIGLDELSEHMASHNTPFSKGAIKGILTDAVACTRELLLMGKNVKFPNLAIFSVGLRVLGGAPTPEEFNVSKYVRGAGQTHQNYSDKNCNISTCKALIINVLDLLILDLFRIFIV